MPIFYQHVIDADTRLGIWKIEETEEFFLRYVPLVTEVKHPHKRLQHLAARFLLQFLFPAFPYDLIRIADTRKPFLQNEAYHFSISHCGDYAASIVSNNKRVGIDIEIPTPKVEKIRHKFLNDEEQNTFYGHFPSPSTAEGLAQATPYPKLTTHHSPLTPHDSRLTTLLWSCKEAVFKWYGDGGVDFSEQILLKFQNKESESVDCLFTKNQTHLTLHYRYFDHLVLTWVFTEKI